MEPAQEVVAGARAALEGLYCGLRRGAQSLDIVLAYRAQHGLMID